jgi:hypothetical protein
VDELHGIRAQILELKAREKELRLEVLDLRRNEREGRTYWARVVEKTRKVLDTEAVEREFGDLTRFYSMRPFSVIYIEKLKDEK